MDTVLEFLRDRARDSAANPAIHQIGPDGLWQSTTWSEAWRQVNTMARRLRELGLQPGHICQQRVPAVQQNTEPSQRVLLH